MNDLHVAPLMYEWARDLPPKVISRISPSQIGGCSRAHYLKIRQVADTTATNPGAILNMQTGFMWEKIIEDSLRHAKLPFISQHKFIDEDLNMEGTLDFALLHTKEDGKVELEILDSKTESSIAAKYRKKMTYLEAHEDYVHQLNAYAIMALRQGFEVSRGRFIVIHRDDSFIEEVPFAFDIDSMKRTMGKIHQMNEWLKTETLPPCDGKYCKIGLCNYGNPNTREPNSKGKLVNTTCCGTEEEINQWRKEWAQKQPEPSK